MKPLNLLYSLLESATTCTDHDSWKKMRSPVQHTERSLALANAIMDGVPAARRRAFICFLCHLVLNTVFAADILAEDGNNTYNPVSQACESGTESTTLMHDITRKPSSMRSILEKLDKDIRGRLHSLSWVDTMAAACLQLLRLRLHI